MSIGIVATAFALVALAELPDKSMIATLMMGSRYRPVLVWVGAASAFAVHVVLAVVAGRLLELLPHRALEIVVAVLFLCGSAYLLLVPQKSEEAKGRRELDTVNRRLAASESESDRDLGPGREADRDLGPGREADRDLGPGTESDEGPGPTSRHKVIATAFVVILIGEFGDLTQLLMVNLVARYHQPWSVLVGSLAALVSVAAIGAFSGRALLRVMPVVILRRGGGVVLAGFAAFSIYSLVHG